MRDRIKAKVSFANAIALLALFVVLGGGAYAAATIKGSDVVDNSLTGRDVNESTLKGVLRCPKSAPNRVAGICYSKIFAAAPWDTALDKCQSRKTRVPTIGEAFLIYRRAGNGLTWTDEVTQVGPPAESAFVRKDAAGVGAFSVASTTAEQYRCVTTPTA